MNDKLFNLYESKWTDLISQVSLLKLNKDFEVKPTNPLLIFVENEEQYLSADIRIAIYGQETNGWYELDNSIEGIQQGYHEFFNLKECYSYGGQFWNGFKRFLNKLNEKYPNKNIRPIWNNIVKIGCNDRKGFPPNYIHDIERKFFPIIKEEMEILKPNIVLFLTGPNYDEIIENNFGDLKSEALHPFNERQLSKIEIENVEFAFRTYHPNYLWRNNIDEYFDRILSEINI